MSSSRALGCLVALAAITATSASAEDWTFGGRLVQRFQADSDRELNDSTTNGGGDDGGFVFESATRVEGDIAVENKRSRWTLESGIGVSFFAGEGASDADDFDHTLPRLALGYTRTGKTSLFEASGVFSIEETSFSQFEDTGIADQDTTETRIEGEARYTMQLTEANSASIGATGSSVKFSDTSTDLTPTDTVGVETAFTRRLSQRTSGSVLFNLGAFWADNEEETESRYAGLSGRVERNLTKNLDLSVRAGAAVVHTEELVGATREDDVVIGLDGEAQLVYRAKEFDSALSASRVLVPSSLGELQTRTSVRFSLGHDINSVSRFDFSTAYSYLESASDLGDNGDDDARQTLSVSPSYRLGLAPDWGMRVGYNYRLSDDDDEVESSHGVFLEVSRDFEIFP